ncbi:MAG: hypothetical protein IT225_07375 [Flavobacteriales bacterium]|nr:hypothetical protein [Flavobacteriales bacterium]
MDPRSRTEPILRTAILSGLLLATVLMVVAASLYPGGTLVDSSSVGFTWSKNFICDLFRGSAYNGAVNPGRPWALVAIAIQSLTDGLFFIRMSRVITERIAILVLKGVGVVNIGFNFMIATPYHDAMVAISSTLSLLGLFFITVFLMRTRLHLLKGMAVACMLVFYYTIFLYGMGDWGLLAVMQKVALICSALLVLVLTLFTNALDFQRRG